MNHRRFTEGIRELREAYRETKRRIWKDLEIRIQSGDVLHRVVNLSRLARNTGKGDLVVVPGKVLGVGRIQHSITVGALDYSQSALDKLRRMGCNAMLLADFVRKYSKKTGVKIVG